jgi:hypothetical protein
MDAEVHALGNYRVGPGYGRYRINILSYGIEAMCSGYTTRLDSQSKSAKDLKRIDLHPCDYIYNVDTVQPVTRG